MEFLFLDDFENAKEYFILCLKEDETDYSALYNIIYCFEFMQQYDEAINYLNKFLDKNPYCEVAWHQVGKLYFHIKEYKKARTPIIVMKDGQIVERGSHTELMGKKGEYGKLVELQSF